MVFRQSKLKYGNKITEVDGVKFRSKGEALRYQELKWLQQTGHIRDLKLQVKHDLRCNDWTVGTYTSDFEYWEGKEIGYDTFIIEDFKGAKTPLFTLKWNILKSMYSSGLEDGTVKFRLTGRGSNKNKRGSLRGTLASWKKAKKASRA